jgi:hypothetical protein
MSFRYSHPSGSNRYSERTGFYRGVSAGLRGEFAAALPGGADSDDDVLTCVGSGVSAGLRGEFAAALPGGADSDDDALTCVGSSPDRAAVPTMARMNAPSRTNPITRRMSVAPS